MKLAFKGGDRIRVERGRRIAYVFPHDNNEMTMSPAYATTKLGDWFTLADVDRAVYMTPGRATLLHLIVNLALRNHGDALTIDEKIDLGKMVAEANGDDDDA